MRTKLKLIRIGKGLNQTEFARLLGVTCPYYNMIENGKMAGSNKFWARLGEVLCLPKNELLDIRFGGDNDD